MKTDSSGPPMGDDINPEEQWKPFKSVSQETPAEVVSFSTRRNQDWFD